MIFLPKRRFADVLQDLESHLSNGTATLRGPAFFEEVRLAKAEFVKELTEEAQFVTEIKVQFIRETINEVEFVSAVTE